MKPRAEGRPSLRGRLLLLLIAGTGLAWAAVAVTTYFDARYHAGRLFDAQLQEYSEVLAAVAGHEAYEIAGQTTNLDHEYGQACTYQVYSRAGDLLLRSHAAPLAPLALADGYSEASTGSARWRVFRRIDAENDLVIVVAHRMDEREAMVRDFALRLLWPFALGLPLLALAIWLAITRSLRPLERLAGDLRGRDAGRLAALDAPDAPREIAPLIDALNELFARVAASFESERRFTGDAAHELRTPLAALRTHAEVALTTENDDRRRRSLEQVVAGVERAGRLVEQMLALARLDAASPGEGVCVDLAATALEAMEPLRADARARGIALDCAASPAVVSVTAEPAMLHALVRNLVENAVRHAPDGGAVRVSVAADGSRARLDVEDSGAGVPPELRERIFDRHFRSPGEGGAAGLGLSIARRVAELHGGTIEAGASEALGGLRVRVALPAGKEPLSNAPHSGGMDIPKETIR